MESNSENIEKNPSKNKTEEEQIKTKDDSSKNLQVNIIQTKNIINTKQMDEINKEIIIHSNTQLNNQKKISPQKNRYPYCIVWTPIPFLTYLIPSIGHAGIADSEGVIHDFAATFYVNIDDFSFGKPTKYFQLELNDKERYDYDKALQKGDLKYNKEIHNLFCNNCHSHVAYVLNQVKYKGKNNYNMVDIWWLFIWKGKYVSFLAFIKTYIGFFIFVLIVGLALR